ncbi:MAG: GAF domain-containing protein [Sphingomonas bacterium]|nr:GAF domain-containing protein [Sphingomonas bacterium]
MASRLELPGSAADHDTTACDREPIHIPGSIQAHGLLLIADRATHRVVAGAGDLEAVFGDDWLGADIGRLLWQDGNIPDDGATAGPGGAIFAGTIDTARGRYDITLHRSGDAMIVELEAAGEAEPLLATNVLAKLEVMATGFERASDLTMLCQRAATAFRALTGFDRVMIYRFLDDDAGRVVAEDSDPDIGSFLHHHFPATDIPRQARALYIRNRARAIPDIDYDPQPIRPADYRHTDLSDVSVRSVSPIPIQYLHNMGVGASASISIVQDGMLWGLIACHHRTAKLMPRDVRMIATVLAGGLARQIRAKEEAASYRERLRLRIEGDALLPRIVEAGDVREAVKLHERELTELLASDGLVFARGTMIDGYGRCPGRGDLADLVDWLRKRSPIELYSTDRLGADHADGRGIAAAASGVLALPLLDDGTMLIWLRAEQVEEVEWAGNPHRNKTTGPDGSLSPRASFASWVEIVRGQARRWTLEEVETAHRLRRTLRDSLHSRQIVELNETLNRSVLEKDALLAQKDMLMKEVDHRVQNSLQLVSAFLSMQARAAGPGDVASSLAEAQSRLSAVALVHRRLYRDDQIESVDLSRYIGELVDDLRLSLGGAWAERMTTDLAPILIPTDRAVSVGLILTELVINATKYAYGEAPGPIEIILEQHRRRFRLIVADQGRGMRETAGGSKTGGFGSRMMNAVVQRIDGEIEVTDNQPGTRASLTAPID